MGLAAWLRGLWPSPTPQEQAVIDAEVAVEAQAAPTPAVPPPPTPPWPYRIYRGFRQDAGSPEVRVKVHEQLPDKSMVEREVIVLDADLTAHAGGVWSDADCIALAQAVTEADWLALNAPPFEPFVPPVP